MRPCFLPAVLLGLLACQAGSDPGSPSRLAGSPIDLTRFRTDSSAFSLVSGLVTSEDRVVRDESAWNQLWQEIHSSETPTPPLPAVDFSREMIVASAFGSRNTGGYNILFISAAETSGRVQLLVLETSPGPTCVTTQVVTQPVDLARLPRRDAPVLFLRTARIRHCGT